jgi:hypothetical protein
MGITWIDMKSREPKDGQDCITRMKHGIIQGTWDAEERNFGRYYWRDMEWGAWQWAPIESIDDEK